MCVRVRACVMERRMKTFFIGQVIWGYLISNYLCMCVCVCIYMCVCVCVCICTCVQRHAGIDFCDTYQASESHCHHTYPFQQYQPRKSDKSCQVQQHNYSSL